MYLHEFQAKNLLKSKNILIPKSFLITCKEQGNEIINAIPSNKIVLKAQVHSGARGKFGGIKIINKNINEINSEITQMINKKLVTNQTGAEGKIIKYILAEEFIEIENEIYVSFYIDRTIESTILTISKFGGINIENNNQSTFLILKIDLDYGIYDYHIRNIIFYLKLEIIYFEKIKNLITNLFNIFKEKNLMLLEINPLIKYENNFYCLDAKMEVDDNSIYKNKDIFDQYDYSQDTETEIKAKFLNLSYISLDGNIGCIVNGAGLAMATLDLLKLNNLNPANFLDIGGNATEETIKNAFKIIKLEKNIKGIFINIFGGIVQCDLIANAILEEIKNSKNNIPIIIRLAGNKSHEGINIIKKSHLNIIAETDLTTSIKIIKDVLRGK
ncbi:MAG TPA: ADP-forming succinate--CoA ligase subunit beta [Candidatus Azoamicus sp. MARI]